MYMNIKHTTIIAGTNDLSRWPSGLMCCKRLLAISHY